MLNIFEINDSSVQEFLESSIYPTGSTQKNFDVFCHFVDQNSSEILRTLLESTADVDFGHQYTYTPLTLAVHRNHLEIAKLLLIKGANPNLAAPYGELPLQSSIRQQNQEMTRLLLVYGANFEAKDGNGTTPLGVACYYGNLRAARTLLLQLNADPNGESEDLTRVALTPLQVACNYYGTIHRNLELIELLLDNRADVQRPDKFGNTALFYAGFPEVVKLLIKGGAEVNHRNIWKETALHRMVRMQRNACVEVMLRREDVDLELRDENGASALHQAVRCGNTEALKLMLRLRDLDLNTHLGHGGNTALHFLTDNPDSLIICTQSLETFNNLLEVLLCYGADVSQRNDKGDSALAYLLRGFDGCPKCMPGKSYYDKISLLEDKFIDIKEHYCSKLSHENDEALQLEFKRELDKLKTFFISAYPKVTLFDLLVSRRKTENCWNSERLQRLWNGYKGNFEEQFPHYGLILNYKVKKALLRMKLIESAIEKLESILGISMPIWSSKKILKYCSRSQMKEFIGLT